MKLSTIAPSILPIALLAAAIATLGATQAATESDWLETTLFDWDELVATPTEVGLWRTVADQATETLERFECHVTTLNPGLDSHPQHQHAQEEFIILKEGLLDVIINGQAQRAGPGSLFFYAANDFHSVRNVGDEPATYLVFNYATEATHHAPAEPAAQSAEPGQLASQVYDWETLRPLKTDKGVRRAFFDAPTVTAARLSCYALTIHAGPKSATAINSALETLVVIKDGAVQVKLKGRTQIVAPGSILYIASRDTATLQAVGSTEATFYVIEIEAAPANP